MVLSVFCDGGARGNPGPSAIGVVIKDDKGNLVHEFGKNIGEGTNNVAEYTAVVEALTWINENKASKHLSISFFLDSELVVSQLTGIYRVKNSRLRELLMLVREKEGEFGGNISYMHIPRERNTEADRMVNEALDGIML